MNKNRILTGLLALATTCLEADVNVPKMAKNQPLPDFGVSEKVTRCLEYSEMVEHPDDIEADYFFGCAKAVEKEGDAFLERFGIHSSIAERIGRLYVAGSKMALQTSSAESDKDKAESAQELGQALEDKAAFVFAAVSASQEGEISSISMDSSPQPPRKPPAKRPDIVRPAEVVRCLGYEGQDPAVHWRCTKAIKAEADKEREALEDLLTGDADIDADILKEISELYAAALNRLWEVPDSGWIPSDRAHEEFEAVYKSTDRTMDDFDRALARSHRAFEYGEAWYGRYDSLVDGLMEQTHDFMERAAALENQASEERIDDLFADGVCSFNHEVFNTDRDHLWKCAQVFGRVAYRELGKLMRQRDEGYLVDKWMVAQVARLYNLAARKAFDAAELEKQPKARYEMNDFGDLAAEVWMQLMLDAND